MRYSFRLDGRSYFVTIEEHAEGPRFVVDGTAFVPEVKALGGGRYETTLDGESFAFSTRGAITEDRSPLDLQIRRAKPELQRLGGRGRKTDGRIKPPMPGKVVEIHVKEGDTVTEGQPLLVLEAMKMQNDIKSPLAGLVEKVHVRAGTNVEATTVMIDLKPAD